MLPKRKSAHVFFNNASMTKDGLGFLRSSQRRMNWINLLQWPAMIVTVGAAWLVASQRKFKRNWGFWLFLLSNLLWVVWGLHDGAYALILLQICLALLNIRGAMKNRPA